MENSTSNWYAKPSKKTISIVLAVWIISMALVLFGSSDGFKVAVPQNILLLLVLPSFLIVVNLLVNYNKNKVKKSS